MAKKYYRKIQKPTPKLVMEGQPQLGNFEAPFEKVNPLDVSNLWNISTPKWLRYFRLKEWQAFQFWYKDYFAFGAVYNAKWLGIMVLSVFNFKTREKSHTFLMVPAWKTRVAKNLFSSTSACTWGSTELLFKNHMETNRITMTGKAAAENLMLKITGFHISEPSVVAIPLGKNRFMYSHKCLMPCEGEMEFKGKTHVFRRNEGLCMMDMHKGFYPYKLSYDWLTAAWFDREGNYYGFNVTRNQSLDAENYNENCFWVNGKMHVLPPVTFKFAADEKTWHITDGYDMVNIDFKPVSQNTVKINLGVIKSDYQAPYGTFTGIIKDMHTTLRLNNVNGMGEIKRYSM